MFRPEFDPYDKLIGLEQQVQELRRHRLLRDQQIIQLCYQQDQLITLIKQLRLELRTLKSSD